MIEYRIAKPQDMDEIIDFINMVFSMLRIPHDFSKLLPKVYGQETRISDIHIIAREGGRVCGCVGVLPFDLRMGGETLRCGYVGSVSAHPRVRGQGVMSELLRRQVARAKEAGMDLMVLGGQRQRYEHAGFAACGSRMTFSLNRSNVRHALGGVDASGIAFRPLEAGGEDEAFAHACYEKKRVSGARSRNRFCLTLRSFGGTPWLILDRGNPAGYLVATADSKTIYEIAAEKALLSAVLKAWIEQKNASPVAVVSSAYEKELNETLAAYCEYYELSSDEMCLCLNPQKVIAAVMRLKNDMDPLEDGTLKLGFGMHGTLDIRVSDGKVSVSRTDEAADLAFEDRAAHEFVFGVNRLAFAKEERKAPRGWFPLHLQIPEPDRF